MSIKVVVSGCCGRMGSRIAALALDNNPPFVVAGAIETKGHSAIGQDLGSFLGKHTVGVKVTDDVRMALQSGDVLIEFTTPAATMDHLRDARALKKAVVIGTTGIPEEDRELVAAFSKEIPVFFSPNMSLGVNVLFELAQIGARRLGVSYDVSIVEAHHKEKKDAPSGTAKHLQILLAEARNPSSLVPEKIPCTSVREGDIVGDHTVIFAGRSERLELTHHAESRDVFVFGALKAAQFVVRQRPGLYDMSHVLKS